MGCALNLFGLLDQTAARHGGRGAVYVGERQVHTWAELRERALRLAASMRAAHPAGTRIAIASENRAEIVELMFATWAAECAYVPINYKLHPQEMVQIIDDACAATVFASTKVAAGLSGALGGGAAKFLSVSVT
jgi:acyl-CoA synthetase (AMP-forming)/AMP-acid ligase II